MGNKKINSEAVSPYAMLHILVIIYGFTPVLGKLISIDALPLVWWRLIISTVVLTGYFRYRRFRIELASKTIILIVLTGLIVGLHWACFYQSIKVSNINTAMCGFATMTLFTALLEPLFFKRRISILEVVLGLSTLIGLVIIAYNKEVKMEGIYYGLMAALTAALFVNINVKFARKHHAYSITFYEFIGAFICVTIISVAFRLQPWLMLDKPLDIFWLVILSVVCTVFPFIEATKIGKHINPFTMTLVNNLEPVYGIILAFLIFSKSEVMNLQFYIGASIIIAGVLLYPVFKKKEILSI
jgi:drug/metabolite transporter (DMT)-like permease